MTGALRRVVVMAVVNTRRSFSSLTDVLWALIMPVLFSFMVISLFVDGGGGGQAVYVVDEDGTALARSFIDGLGAKAFDVREVRRDEAVAALAEERSDVAVVIPAGFADGVAVGVPALEFLRGRSSSTDASINGPVDGPTNAAVDAVETTALTVAYELATGDALPAIHVVHEAPKAGVSGRELAKVRATFGIYLVFAFSALFARGMTLHNEHQNGTLQRIVAAGVAYGEIVAAHVLTIFLVGVVQAGVVLTLTGLLGTLWLTAGWGVLVVTLLGALFAACGLSVCMSGLTRNAMLIQWLAGGVPTLLAMMGGAFFPLESAPPALQQVARINPIYWVMELFAEGFVYQGVAGQLWPLSVLLLIGVLGAVIGIQGLRRVEL